MKEVVWLGLVDAFQEFTSLLNLTQFERSIIEPESRN